MQENDNKSNQFDKFNDRDSFTNSDFENKADTFPKNNSKSPAKNLTFLEKLKNLFNK